MTTQYLHRPVLMQEVLRELAIRPSGTYIDGTLGRGGHALAILQQLNASGRLIAIDKDPEALANTRSLFQQDPRVVLLQGSFAGLAAIAKAQNVFGEVQGILLDLGVSSPQLDDPKRGFSFLQDGPLDMRMDNTQGDTAAEWLARAKENEITTVLRDFGEERFAKRIAHAIVTERQIKPITTTAHLAEVVSKANPAWEKHKHPATRSFQAIRIFINKELDDLEVGLEQAIEVLAVGGRLGVLSFHSLEDRLVKRFIRSHSQDQKYPVNLPVVAKEMRPRLRAVGRGVKPTADEVAANPRSRSAVFRVAEKLL